eukprot:COSAG06_NODE_20904_length_777_cov_0.812684_1_plen_102_part_10
MEGIAAAATGSSDAIAAAAASIIRDAESSLPTVALLSCLLVLPPAVCSGRLQSTTFTASHRRRPAKTKVCDCPVGSIGQGETLGSATVARLAVPEGCFCGAT